MFGLKIYYLQRKFRNVFQNDIVCAIYRCIKDDYEKKEAYIYRCALEQKPNSLFIYNSDGWVEINAKDLDNSICKIHKKCMQEFLRWQERAESEMTTQDFTRVFTENIRKINNKTTSYISKKIFQKLQDEYKINIKSLINIEIE